jgi:hypothetical protein
LASISDKEMILTTGANFMKQFFLVTDDETKQANVFVPGKPLQALLAYSRRRFTCASSGLFSDNTPG